MSPAYRPMRFPFTRKVEEISGQNVEMYLTGGVTVAATSERWEVLRYEHERHRVFGIESHLIGPGEIRKLCPIMDTSNVVGGLFDANENHIDPYGSTHALAKSARKAGAEIYLNTKVEDLVHKSDGSWTVVTDKGNIHCEHVVNAAGLWAREVQHFIPGTKEKPWSALIIPRPGASCA
jgi:dimethylglycine dehydrogenase